MLRFFCLPVALANPSDANTRRAILRPRPSIEGHPIRTAREGKAEGILGSASWPECEIATGCLKWKPEPHHESFSGKRSATRESLGRVYKGLSQLSSPRDSRLKAENDSVGGERGPPITHQSPPP